MNPTPLTGAKRVAGVVLLAVFALAGCSSTTSNPSSKPSTDQSATGSPTTVEANATPAFSAGSIRVDGPKIAEFSQEELEQQVLACNLDISELITELGVDQTGWNFGYVDASIYSDQFFDSAQQAWDENEIFYFSYNFLGPYKGDYRQQIQIMIGAWKTIEGTSRLSEVKQFAISAGRSEYVYQLSPENNFAVFIAYGTDQGAIVVEPTLLGKIGPIETFVKQLVACEIPYFVSNE